MRAERTIEFFSGKGSFSRVAGILGHSTFTIDIQEKFHPDMVMDILKMHDYCAMGFDRAWFSPPCTTFSVASIGTHWKGGKNAYIPKTKESLKGMAILRKTIKIISVSKPRKWYIENPRGVMRKVIDSLFSKYEVSDYVRHTVTYCQYGDDRMKPTDIWTNDRSWIPKPPCRNGSPCHPRTPRGSHTAGTQSIKGREDRSIIPEKLFYEIFESKKGRR